LKILHIVNWYPNPKHPKEALWIKKHVQAIELHVEQQLFHLNISSGKFEFSLSPSRLILKIPKLPWRIAELLSGITLLMYLSHLKVSKRFDLINFHIAYPNLTYWHLIKRNITIPVVITEHWSAYHYNFGVTKKLPRIQRIFGQNIPVLAVSAALIKDISNFSNFEFTAFVVPNIVDLPYSKGNDRRANQFFMVGQWKEPKRPELVISAFIDLLKDYPKSELNIGGYGPLFEQMKVQSSECDAIKFLGSMDGDQIAYHLNISACLIHPSDYETFSVICAEAAMLRCPVIASNVGGIPEFINHKNGVLVTENSSEAFNTAMRLAIDKPLRIEKVPDFSRETVGRLYFESLQKVLNEAN
jgi:glycosyltransferase involved in cell wall biosynthesis